MGVGHFGRRVFTLDDQEAFAAFSGDRNPMHVDPVAARRTQAGSCALHGVHAFLWALEALAAAGFPLRRLVAARVDFARFIALDRQVELALRSDGEDLLATGRLTAELLQGDRRVVWLELRFAEPQPALAEADHFPRMTLPDAPAEPTPVGLQQAEGAFDPAPAAARMAARLFPCLTATLGLGRTVSLGLVSALVGMVVPGLYSILSTIRLDFGACDEAPGWLEYRVALSDLRFRMATIAVSGPGLSGSVGVFMRFPPVPAPTLEQAEARLSGREFADRQALVVGGSRGLGACAAKLIAAGGGSVALTYLSGLSEAEAICAEIADRYGPDRCAIVRYDCAADPARQLDTVPGSFTHVYYFATGPIADPSDGRFDRVRFDGFVDIYVAGFERLARTLVERQPETPLHMLYPSSAFVEMRPRSMTEYAMAKAAGEILCVDLARRHRSLTISTPRLPRVLTDQTATVPPVPSEDPVAVLLPILRAEARVG